ncbi:hypothetical protein SUGI_1031310 [Cryptomeria japonica]|nr:hypothetical protein SUGI_1031310 [Cryptomeria japonica]
MYGIKKFLSYERPENFSGICTPGAVKLSDLTNEIQRFESRHRPSQTQGRVFESCSLAIRVGASQTTRNRRSRFHSSMANKSM